MMLSFTLAIAALVTATSANAPAPAAFKAPAIEASPDFAALASTTLAFAPEAIDSSEFIAPEFIAVDALQDAASPAATTAPDVAPVAATNASASAANHSNRFFHRGSWRWNIQLGVGSDLGDETFGIGGFGVSYFLEDSFTMEFELNGLYFSQSGEDDDGNEGENTAAINLALLFRWHFWISDDQRWSIYADAGAGIMFSGEDVPPGGTGFNFTPQAGMGFSALLDAERDIRLLSGFRWYHVSNANTSDNNPGLNTLLIYAGVNFPF